MGKRILLTILINGFIIVSVNSQQQWPTNEWLKTTPQKVDLIADSLIALDRDFASGKYGQVDNMLIIRHGKIAYEKSYSHNYAELYKQESKEKSGLNSGEPGGPYNYFNSWWHPYYHDTKLHTQQSVSKTITSMIIGVAITRNDFPDINTPVLHFFDTSKVENIDDRKRKMTVRHLLTMTAGFDWNESLPYSDPKNDAMVMEASLDWAKYVINKPMLQEPGEKFNYNSGATELLAYIFRVATGTDIEEYAVKNLLKPLGITKHYWKRSASGLVDAEGGIYLENVDVAKLFYLYLKNGQWENKQIINPEWVKQSVTPFIKFSPTRGYGYQWWISMTGNGTTNNIWQGNGFGGQFPMVIPEYDMVVVFNAWDINPKNRNPNYRPDILMQKVIGAVNKSSKAEK